MGKEKQLFKSDERKSRSEVSTFLHQLADRVSEGQVTFRFPGNRMNPDNFMNCIQGV